MIRGMRRRLSLLDKALAELKKLPYDSLTGCAIYCQPLILHFIIFTGFRVEAVVRKPTAGLSVLKQALVPILMGPLPQQVTINQTLTLRDYLRIVFTAWQFEVKIEIEVKLKWPFSAQTSTCTHLDKTTASTGQVRNQCILAYPCLWLEFFVADHIY